MGANSLVTKEVHLLGVIFHNIILQNIRTIAACYSEKEQKGIKRNMYFRKSLANDDSGSMINFLKHILNILKV